jgi:predicted RNase H-like nuclease
MNAGCKEDLVSVNIADPGHDALVQQCRLDRASGSRQQFPETPGVDRQGIRTQP